MEKLLALASLAQRIYGGWVFQRLLTGAILVAGITILASIMIGSLLIAGLVAVYLALVHSGMEPYLAMGIIALSALAITLLLALALQHMVRGFRRAPAALLNNLPAVSRVKEALEAFIAGLTDEGPRA